MPVCWLAGRCLRAMSTAVLLLLLSSPLFAYAEDAGNAAGGEEEPDAANKLAVGIALSINTTTAAGAAGTVTPKPKEVSTPSVVLPPRWYSSW